MFVYSPHYYVDIGNHVFRVDKYKRLYKRLTEEEQVSTAMFVEPEPITPEQALCVHTYSYVEDLLGGTLNERTLRSELPMSKEIVQGFFLNAGGSCLAASEALRTGWAMNIGGGFHHAFADHAEGFCYLNDVAIAAQISIEEYRIKRVLICDLDVHQGNGTAHIFRSRPEVFTFSMHQQDLYPIKQKSDLDIGLPIGIDDEEYLRLLEDNLSPAVDAHKPDLILYVAGADPYKNDQLGSLGLTIEGLRMRDRTVIRTAKSRNIPIATLLAGGYAFDVKETVEIHLNTARELLEKAS